MVEDLTVEKPCFTYFNSSIEAHILPDRFTFPFFYEPHSLCVKAATELQDYLKTQTEWKHSFGLSDSDTDTPIGKMFGVLVVKNRQGEIGYLSAVSGKLAGVNHHSRLVPPVFDMLKIDGFFKAEESQISKINYQIEDLEQDETYLEELQKLADLKLSAESEIAQQKELIRLGRAKRKDIRAKASLEMGEIEFEKLLLELNKESVYDKNYLKYISDNWKSKITTLQSRVDFYSNQIKFLKETRKKKSAALQLKLYDQYQFLNILGNRKGLCEIFEKTSYLKPIAGAGECAAPKLLQYAFLNQMTPIAMAEFWWGVSPASEIRKHGTFYPACRSKCEPILGHMLEGMDIDPNPWLANPDYSKVISIIYEDDYLAVINKPAGLLSVPGTHIPDSVYDRMRLMYPDATGPLIVHRLDMATSGIMLIPKTIESHHFLQAQFMRGTIKKRYVANLEGNIVGNEGVVELPLRIDYDNRPQQMVCFEHGKYAKTIWKVIDRKDNGVRVHFWPVTGRTHQLRMHAAHQLGLGCPIVGDILYGKKSERMHLHAEFIEFKHPGSNKKMQFEVQPDF